MVDKVQLVDVELPTHVTLNQLHDLLAKQIELYGTSPVLHGHRKPLVLTFNRGPQPKVEEGQGDPTHTPVEKQPSVKGAPKTDEVDTHHDLEIPVEDPKGGTMAETNK